MFFVTLLRDCLLMFAIFGLAILVLWWQKKYMQSLQVRLVAEEVVEDEEVSNPSEGSNDYDRLPDLNNIQQAMNIILEKSEDSMNEGDYLEVANKLKSFYTDVKKLESLVRESAPLYIKQNVIVESHLDYYKDVSFRLSREELRNLMNGRIRERDIRMIDRIKENIVVCYRELNDIQRNKRFYWDGIKSLPDRGSIKDNMRIQHKKFVEAEKNIIESIRRQREHMHILEARVGNVV
jgi:hypothetical protein